MVKSELLPGSTATTCAWDAVMTLRTTSNEGSSNDVEWGLSDEQFQSTIRRQDGGRRHKFCLTERIRSSARVGPPPRFGSTIYATRVRNTFRAFEKRSLV